MSLTMPRKTIKGCSLLFSVREKISWKSLLVGTYALKEEEETRGTWPNPLDYYIIAKILIGSIINQSAQCRIK